MAVPSVPHPLERGGRFWHLGVPDEKVQTLGRQWRPVGGALRRLDAVFDDSGYFGYVAFVAQRGDHRLCRRSLVHGPGREPRIPEGASAIGKALGKRGRRADPHGGGDVVAQRVERVDNVGPCLCGGC